MLGEATLDALGTFLGEAIRSPSLIAARRRNEPTISSPSSSTRAGIVEPHLQIDAAILSTSASV